jgi:hypothetical protein
MTWHEEERKKRIELERLKSSLAEHLGWPYLENLSWFQLWPGGWCFHGRSGALMKEGDRQKSMNFELPMAVHSPEHSIKVAIKKVQDNPTRLAERVRWYCDEHGWEVIHPRGVMVSGCPTCGTFKCEVIRKGEEEEE